MLVGAECLTREGGNACELRIMALPHQPNVGRDCAPPARAGTQAIRLDEDRSPVQPNRWWGCVRPDEGTLPCSPPYTPTNPTKGVVND